MKAIMISLLLLICSLCGFSLSLRMNQEPAERKTPVSDYEEFCFKGYRFVHFNFNTTFNGHLVQLIGKDGKPVTCTGE